MRIGVFSDVHGNLEALQACLARLDKEGAERFIFCGDAIGYGPDPETCVQKILQLPLLACVLGNHDAALDRPELESYFNYDARLALEKTRKLLSPGSLYALTTLPERVQMPSFCVVHGTPADPIKEYFSSMLQFKSNLSLWEGSVCFVGHTHLSFYMKGTTRNCSVNLCSKDGTEISLTRQSRYVINPGAVGKPRDKNPQAAFGLWDTKANTFTFFRESYDVKKTQEKMRKYKFPSFLIDSLAVGY